MVEKLGLPFSLLSDPGGEKAIKPYGVWHAEPGMARPAIVLVDPDGQEAFRRVSEDFADRSSEDEVVDRARALGLDPVAVEQPVLGPAEAGEKAFPAEALVPYFRGSRFAAASLGGRVPEAKEAGERLREQSDRYIEVAQARASG